MLDLSFVNVHLLIDVIERLESLVSPSAIPSNNAVSANIKDAISGQSTAMAKGCIYVCFDMVDTTFSYRRALIACYFLQESSKVKESFLH